MFLGGPFFRRTGSPRPPPKTSGLAGPCERGKAVWWEARGLRSPIRNPNRRPAFATACGGLRSDKALPCRPLSLPSSSLGTRQRRTSNVECRTPNEEGPRGLGPSFDIRRSAFGVRHFPSRGKRAAARRDEAPALSAMPLHPHAGGSWLRRPRRPVMCLAPHAPHAEHASRVTRRRVSSVEARVQTSQYPISGQ